MWRYCTGNAMHFVAFVIAREKLQKITEKVHRKNIQLQSIRKAHLRSVKSCKDIYRILKREHRGMYEDW